MSRKCSASRTQHSELNAFLRSLWVSMHPWYSALSLNELVSTQVSCDEKGTWRTLQKMMASIPPKRSAISVDTITWGNFMPPATRITRQPRTMNSSRETGSTSSTPNVSHIDATPTQWFMPTWTPALRYLVCSEDALFEIMPFTSVAETDSYLRCQRNQTGCWV